MQVPSHQQIPASDPQTVRTPTIPIVLRLVYCGLGLGIFGLLILARGLQPNPDGLGTHEQLGLPPCGFKMFFGKPCPSCGMTTSWAHAVRGQILAGATANLGGFSLALLSLPASVWLIISGWRGNWFWKKPDPLVIAVLLAVPIVLTLVQWGIRFS